jgi:peptidoglycan/LPS O-acetylase OafA/YrhL
MLLGCNYFTYKYERDEDGNELHPSKLSNLFTAMKEDNKIMLICNGSGSLLMFILCAFCKTVNLDGDNISITGTLIYLLFSRPLYIFGFSLYVMPYILKNRMIGMIRSMLVHRHFVLYAKLTYGVFLSNTIFMQYRSFNLENGIWAQVFETNMSFVANLAFSFGFSLVTYLLVEAPFSNILNDFFR